MQLVYRKLTKVEGFTENSVSLANLASNHLKLNIVIHI